MGPYLERTKQMIRETYRALESAGTADRVSIGLVGYRTDAEHIKGMEYTTRIFQPLEPNAGRAWADPSAGPEQLVLARESSRRLHAAIGRQWYLPQFADRKQAIDYGDRCWSRITSNWKTVRDQGLTQHANWWPAVYRQACAAWGERPDDKALAFATTYEATRADLKEMATSG